MAAIITVQNGVTVEDKQHFNQYAQTFSNVLGVTDTAQDALGRLVIPRGTSYPSAPSSAQLFYNTDSRYVQAYDASDLIWRPSSGVLQYLKHNIPSTDVIAEGINTLLNGFALSIIGNSPAVVEIIAQFEAITERSTEATINAFYSIAIDGSISKTLSDYRYVPANTRVDVHATVIYSVVLNPGTYNIDMYVYQEGGNIDFTMTTNTHILAKQYSLSAFS